MATVDHAFKSVDGRLTLFARQRGSTSSPLTVLCLHGLTRNSADFDVLAERLAPKYLVIAADQRGRGRSDSDPEAANYHPMAYAADMFAMLDHLAIDQVVVIGTSMGGLMAMLMGAMQPHRIRGIVLNDIGPEIPIEGLDRLRTTFAAHPPARTWDEAAEQARRMNDFAFPDYTDADWRAFARRTFVEDDSGQPLPAYDPAILGALHGADPTVVPPDLWAVWDALKTIPILTVAGGLSDIIDRSILDRMAANHPGLQIVMLPNRGHAPMLDEEPAVRAIEAFLLSLKDVA